MTRPRDLYGDFWVSKTAFSVPDTKPKNSKICRILAQTITLIAVTELQGERPER